MVRKQMAADHTTGLAIALMEGDAVWARAYGLADLENGSPMKPESSFRLASITKPMTATAVLQLVEQGKIDLDAEIQTYVPYFPRKKHPVTVRQLLGHLGGIPHYQNRAVELHIKEHKTTREAIAIFQDFDLVADPGTRYSYTTYGYNLLGAAIEGASGQPYGDYMREHVWGPLAMKDTRLDDPLDIIPNRVRGYEWAEGRLRNSEFVDVSSRFAGGGTRTTVIDLLKFARGFLDGKLVSRATMERMTQRMALSSGRFTDYGMGWGIDPLNGHYVISHGGSQNETRTLLFLFPARKAVIAAATNFESGDLFWYVQAFAYQLLGERWDRSGGSAAYVAGKLERARLGTARDAFLHGLFEYERRGKAMTEDPAKLRQAFAYFNDCVRSGALRNSFEATRKKCRDGLHPVAGEPLTVVGSFMASTLADRPEGTGGYHASGAVPFFADYIAAYRSTRLRRDLRFHSDFEKQIAGWSQDWARTFNEFTRTPAVTSS
jgi:CubicO group peptidase (beta-lactamase class C family)